MKSTSAFKQQVKELRQELINDITIELQKHKNGKMRFTETQAPRYANDHSWCDLTEIRTSYFGEPEFGWHDERCSAKGANAWVGTAKVSTEILLRFHELIFG